MPRYAIAHNLSGLVRGVAFADDPVAACRKLDLSLGDDNREYEELGPRSRSAHATASAYAVYEATVELARIPEQLGIATEQVPGLTKVAVVVFREQPAPDGGGLR